MKGWFYAILLMLLCVSAFAQVENPMHNGNPQRTSQYNISADWDVNPPSLVTLTGIISEFVLNGTVSLTTYATQPANSFSYGTQGNVSYITDTRCVSGSTCLLLQGNSGSAVENVTLSTIGVNLSGRLNNVINITFADIDLETSEGFSVYGYTPSAVVFLYEYNGSNNGLTNSTWSAASLQLVHLLIPTSLSSNGVIFTINLTLDSNLNNASVDAVILDGFAVTVNNGFTSSGSLNLGTGASDYQPLVGNVVGDSHPEILLPFALTYGVFSYSAQTQTMSTLFTDLNSTGAEAFPHITGVLYDGTGDGLDDLYYCGQRANETVIVAYSFSPTLRELWSVVVGDTLPVSRCYMTSGGGNNMTFTPLVNEGSLYFFTHNITGVLDGAFDVYKIDPLTGSFISRPTMGLGDPTYNQGCFAPGTTMSAAFLAPWRAINTAIQGYTRNQVSPSICPIGTRRRISIPTDCYDTAPSVVVGRGIMQLYADDLSVVSTFGTNGVTLFATFGNAEQQAPILSSPACLTTSAGTQESFIGYNADSTIVSMYTIDSTTLSVLDNDFEVNIDAISDLFKIEASNQATTEDDEVCFIASKSTSGLHLVFCTDIDNPFTADQVSAYHYGNEKFRPTVVSSSEGFGLRGPSPQYMISSLGVFYPSDTNDADPRNFNEEVVFATEESFLFDPSSYLPLDGTCIGADIDEDGFSDVICVTATNITILTATDEVVTPEEGGIWSVSEVSPVPDRCATGQTCSVINDTNVTYRLSFSEFSTDEVWFSYDCDADQEPGASAAVFVSDGYEITCEYPDPRPPISTTFYLTNETPPDELYTEANTKIATVLVSANGINCNFNNIPEPEQGETIENCLPDFTDEPTPEEEEAAANALAREQALADAGVIDITIGSLTLDANGDIVESGVMKLLKDNVYLLLGFVVAFIFAIGLIVFLIALIARLNKR